MSRTAIAVVYGLLWMLVGGFFLHLSVQAGGGKYSNDVMVFVYAIGIALAISGVFIGIIVPIQPSRVSRFALLGSLIGIVLVMLLTDAFGHAIARRTLGGGSYPFASMVQFWESFPLGMILGGSVGALTVLVQAMQPKSRGKRRRQRYPVTL